MQEVSCKAEFVDVKCQRRTEPVLGGDVGLARFLTQPRPRWSRLFSWPDDSEALWVSRVRFTNAYSGKNLERFIQSQGGLRQKRSFVPQQSVGAEVYQLDEVGLPRVLEDQVFDDSINRDVPCGLP